MRTIAGRLLPGCGAGTMKRKLWICDKSEADCGSVAASKHRASAAEIGQIRRVCRSGANIEKEILDL